MRRRPTLVLMIVCAILAGAVALLSAAARPLVYEAQAIVLDRDSTLQVYPAPLGETDLRQVAADAETALRLDGAAPVRDLRRHLRFTSVPRAGRFLVRALGDNGPLAKKRADAFALQYANTRRRRETSLLSARLNPLRARIARADRVRGPRARMRERRLRRLLRRARARSALLISRRSTYVARPATVPTDPAAPAIWRSAAGGALGGLGTAVLVLVALRAGARRPRSPAETADRTS